jgi:tRNA modification GTPase
VTPWPDGARQASLCTIHDEEKILDHSVVTIFESPATFTGEDTVEISCHGGYLVPAAITGMLISAGARQAEPGEFTRRAVLNGKMDILQAEAVADLIDARSSIMQRTALDQLDGGLSRRLASLRNDVIGLEALIAYDVDFPEEDDGPVPRERIETTARQIVSSLKALLATSPAGELIREGAIVVIAGPPNAGKSSLFNALLGTSRSIVTEIPGTTRDAIEAVIDSGQWPLRLVDTAGLRESTDQIEQLGIEVSERYLKKAHVVLACAETREDLSETLRAVHGISPAIAIPVHTKVDLVTHRDQMGDRAIGVSAETGEGLRELLGAINSVIGEEIGIEGYDAEAPLLTRARHRHALSSACGEMEEFERAWSEKKLPATIAAVHLRTAVFQLETLIGTVDVEDILDRLFSSFCVGK